MVEKCLIIQASCGSEYPGDVHKVGPLEWTRRGATMRIIASIDDASVIERILRHFKQWDPQSNFVSSLPGR